MNKIIRNLWTLTAVIGAFTLVACGKVESPGLDGPELDGPKVDAGSAPVADAALLGKQPDKKIEAQEPFQFDENISAEWKEGFTALVQSAGISGVSLQGISAKFSFTSGGKMVASLADGRRIVVCPDRDTCSAEWAFYAVFSASAQAQLLAHVAEPSGLSLNFKQPAAFVQDESCQGVEFNPTESPATQYVPLCRSKINGAFESFYFDSEVRNTGASDLSVAMLFLGSDGCVYGVSENKMRLNQGAVLLHEGGGSSLPVNKTEYLMALGSTDPDFNLAGFNSCEKAGAEQLVNLLAQIKAQPGGIIGASRKIQTVLNRVLAAGEGGVDIGKPREYTVKDFDIRPYLPDDRNSSLYKVLYFAQQLTGKSKAEGIGYKQHAWAKATDDENLALGIDCSRAIWYSFTRANLLYTAKNVVDEKYNDQAYIPTVSMVSENSLLARQFERCDDQDVRLGDVLVYRRTDKDTGHVVMVIDPEKRIAWGSHGWDGNGLTPGVVPDVGAEYQLIKRKKDWQAWDRRTMTLRACWRYKDFVDIDDLDIGNNAVDDCDFSLENCQPLI